MKTRTLLLFFAFMLILPSVSDAQVGNLLKNKMGKVINAGARTANKEVDNKIDSAATKETEKRIALEKEKAAEKAKSDTLNKKNQPSKTEGDKPSDQASQGGINLGKLMGNDPAKVEKFAFKFLQSAQQGLDEIEAALQKENLAELATLGHRNKSPARTVGAQGYAELCLALEKFKGGGDIDQARKIVAEMRALLVQITDQVNKEFK